jgi:hypothetical protein
LAEFGFGQVALGHRQGGDIDALEIAAFAGQQAKAGFLQARAEQVALGGIESRQLR